MNKRKLFSVLSSTAIFFSLNSMAPSASANSQTLSNLEQQQKELQEEQNRLKGNINDAENEMQSLDSERQQLRNEIAEIQQNIDDILAQIQAQEEEIARLEEEINKLNKEIEILQEKIIRRYEVLAEQARGVQTTVTPQNILEMIISAESLTDLVGKIEVINLIVQNNNNIMEEQIADQQRIEAAREEITLAQEESNRIKEGMEANRNQLVSQRQELDQKVQLVTEKYNLTSDERNSLLSEQNSIAAKTEEINKKVKAEKDRIAAEKARIAAEKARKEEEARRAAEAARVQTSSSSSSSAPVVVVNQGGWHRPAYGYVTSEYGMRLHPILGYNRLHAGIDIGGGGPILAAKSGTVTVATYHYSYGYYVKIDHGDGTSSLYAHMQPNLLVSPGQSVSGGQQVGTMGTTGSSTGVHLHFEIHQNGRAVNPRNYIGF